MTLREGDRWNSKDARGGGSRPGAVAAIAIGLAAPAAGYAAPSWAPPEYPDELVRRA